jgi:hypothetical protein
VATILTFDIDNIPQQDFLLHVCTTVGVLSKRVVMQGEHLAGRHVGPQPALARFGYVGVLCQPV